MSENFDEMYRNMIQAAADIPVLPGYTGALIYDPLFEMDWVIDEVKENQIDLDSKPSTEAPNTYYRAIFKRLHALISLGAMEYVCNSDDVDDPIEYLDYDYYWKFINPECPILFHQASHPIAIPSRVIFYHPHFQIEICDDQRNIYVCETNQNVRSLFYIEKKKDRIKAIKEMLFNSDRPRLEDPF